MTYRLAYRYERHLTGTDTMHAGRAARHLLRGLYEALGCAAGELG